MCALQNEALQKFLKGPHPRSWGTSLEGFYQSKGSFMTLSAITSSLFDFAEVFKGLCRLCTWTVRGNTRVNMVAFAETRSKLITATFGHYLSRYSYNWAHHLHEVLRVSHPWLQKMAFGMWSITLWLRKEEYQLEVPVVSVRELSDGYLVGCCKGRIPLPIFLAEVKQSENYSFWVESKLLP